MAEDRVEAARTFPQLFFSEVVRRGDALALRHKQYGIWHRISPATREPRLAARDGFMPSLQRPGVAPASC